MDLTQLAGGRSDKGQTHGYWEIYNLLLQGRRVNRLFEVGVHRGESLAVWAEAFPDAEIHGADIRKANVPDGVVFHQGDAYTPEFVERLPRFDVIVDDGSHEPEDQLFVVEHYADKLEPGGVLVIEDIVDHETAATLAKASDRDVFVVDRSFGYASDSRLLCIL